MHSNQAMYVVEYMSSNHQTLAWKISIHIESEGVTMSVPSAEGRESGARWVRLPKVERVG
jgi:hypothetical protein